MLTNVIIIKRRFGPDVGLLAATEPYERLIGTALKMPTMSPSIIAAINRLKFPAGSNVIPTLFDLLLIGWIMEAGPELIPTVGPVDWLIV